MGSPHPSPVRQGIYLRGPDRRSRLIQLPATFAALIEKAAFIFDIDRNIYDVLIVLAEEEDCEIEEDSLPVLHDRERLLVKAIPRNQTDPGMLGYQSQNAIAGPSHRVELPAIEPPPAPFPTFLDLPSDLSHDNMLVPSSASQQGQTAASLPSVMKVKTCPNQNQAARTAKEITTAHTSLNSAHGVASSARSPTALPTASTGSSTTSSGATVPTRRKRDVRKERKKHAERTIARERAAIEAEEAAAAAARADASSSSSQGQSIQSIGGKGEAGGTLNGDQSRRRISFVGLPDESEESSEASEKEKGLPSDGSTMAKNEIAVSPSGNALKAVWDPDDSGEESQESPAKKRKLNAEAALASRREQQPLPPSQQEQQQQQQAPPQRELEQVQPQPQQVPQQSKHEGEQGMQLPVRHSDELRGSHQLRVQDQLSSEAQIRRIDEPQQSGTGTLSTRQKGKAKETSPEKAAAGSGSANGPSPFMPSAHGRVRSTSHKAVTSPSSSDNIIEISEDSEEEEFTGISPTRQYSSQSPSQSPNKLVLPRGRPPVDPEKRAEYERIKEEIKRQKLTSPDTTMSPAASQERRRYSSPSKAGSHAGGRLPSLLGKNTSGSASSSQPIQTSHPSTTSKDVVGETPPGSPVLQQSVDIVLPPTRRLQLQQLPTPPPSRQAPKKAPASRGGVGANEHITGTIRHSETGPKSTAMDIDSGSNGANLPTSDEPVAMHVDSGPSASASNEGAKKGKQAETAKEDQLIRSSTNLMAAAAASAANRASLPAQASTPAKKSDTNAESTTPVVRVEIPISTTMTGVSTPPASRQPVSAPMSGQASSKPMSPPVANATPSSSTVQASSVAMPSTVGVWSATAKTSHSQSSSQASPARQDESARHPAHSRSETVSSPPVATPSMSLEIAYQAASNLVEQVVNHPSNDFINGKSIRDFSRFVNEHPEGRINLLVIRKRVETRYYHGPRYAEWQTENAPLFNFAAELNRSWENMRAFFGPESKQAKSVSELQTFSSRVLDEWTKSKKSQGSRSNSGAATGGVSGSGSAGASANGASASNGSGAGSTADGHSRNKRSGNTSGRSTPVLDAKAIQSAARNGGQLPSALGLSMSTSSSQGSNGTGGPRAKGTTSTSTESDTSSGSQAWQSWIAKTMPGKLLNKALGTSQANSSSGSGSGSNEQNSSDSSSTVDVRALSSKDA
ncbi:hypothetical protein A4X09_0g3871 [Tilletia walkeri]|uniref:Uncharacterized protein n=1 Tax=Tilletia walkeri TaxID=117179 RepID=A0A8X7T4I2_9BASI|nr:hypothetical protein A4X09_0g3871 [Tilletia walkeri]